jgi:predicted O-methyltransferase YrrM
MDEFPLTAERHARTQAYIRSLFAGESPQQAAIMPAAIAAGLRPIEVGPETGRFLAVLLRSLGRHGTGATLAIEIGTLAGYSATWLAQGLAPGGMLHSIELEPAHITIAQANLARCNVADRVTIHQGKGSEVLPRLLSQLGPAAADFILFDAERSEYPALINTAHTLLRPGGILAIDNTISAKRFIPDPYAPGEPADPMDTLNRAMAVDPRFISTLVPIGNGLLLCTRL